MLQFQDVRKGYGTGEVLKRVSFQVQPGEHVGLVGRNGSGKSTILRLVSGLEPADGGDIVYPGRWRIGAVRQHPEPEFPDQSLLDFASTGCPEVRQMAARLDQLEKVLAENGSNASALAEFGRLQSGFEARGGYERRHRAEGALTGLGFKPEAHALPFRTFSGGWRMRAELARVLMADPDLLLLDEPTNYLDLPAIEWLRQSLANFPGTFLLVSHDRFLLNELTAVTLAVEAGAVTRYQGNYDAYRKLRAEALIRNEAAIRRQDLKIAAIEEFADRFGAKASKASQAKSRLKEIDRMDRVESMAVDNDIPLRLQFPEPARSGDRAIRMTGIEARYGSGPVLFSGIELTLERGMRAALVGANGLGKTTLLRVMAGALKPSAGERELGANVTVGYLPQQYSELLDPKLTVLETARNKTPERTDGVIRSGLGAYGFTGEAVDKTVAVISGGEKLRLSLYLISQDKPNLLLLDEPTTHLDIPGCEALQEAVNAFPGTVCVVSHDVAFLRATANRILEMRPGEVNLFHGDYAYYCEKRADRDQQTAAAGGGGSVSGRKMARKEAADRRKAFTQEAAPLRKRIATAETALSKLDAEEKVIVNRFDTGTVAPEDMFALNRKLVEISDTRERLTADWEKAVEALDALETEYAED